MNCICDEFIFPPETQIPPGLTRLGRQIGTFAEFRRALLRAASIRSTALLDEHPLWSMRYLTERDRDSLKKTLEAIGGWRGRHPKDFGMMLIEMWAYVCDLTSFYDDVFAHEAYVRTARRRDSLRKLVAPLGYVPRPAVGAIAELAMYGDGRRAVSLPIGTSFRSGAFPGSPPQIFELGVETKIHPLLNEWRILPIRRATFGVTGASRQTFLCESGSVTLKAGDIVLVKVGTSRFATTVSDVATKEGADHVSYSAVTFSAPVWVPGGTPVSAVQLLKAAAKASLWTRTSPAYGSLLQFVGGILFPIATYFLLDSISSAFKKDQDVIVERGGTLTASGIRSVATSSVTIQSASTSEVKDKNNVVIAKVPVPAVTAQTTEISITPRLAGVDISFSATDDAPQISIHHSFVTAGKVTIEALTEIDQADPLNVRTPAVIPRDALTPGKFQIEDFNGSGVTRPGSLNFANGHFSIQGDPWPEKLTTPVKLLGNIVPTSRGETVHGEIIGIGDSSIPNQSFTLKKSPLTYLPAPSDKTPSGLTSTLTVYVGGVQWTEAPSFYGRDSEAEIYIVRQNDKSDSVVTFGDGVLSRRLNTGVPVVAYYRFGAGAAMPPSGSIGQVAKPVKGLKGVHNPVAAYGGADAEPAGSLQKYAPRSALLLGRAVSLADFEAAAASYSGVRAVAAEWRWSTTLQVPAAHLWYLANGDLTELLLNKLRSLTQPDTPIQVERAQATQVRLSIQLAVDPKRLEGEVLTAARTALMDTETGLLPPEQLGIGKPLFRSRLFDFLLNVPGVVSITGLSFGYAPFSNFGVKPSAGHYFDFTNQLYLNGRNS